MAAQFIDPLKSLGVRTITLNTRIEGLMVGTSWANTIPRVASFSNHACDFFPVDVDDSSKEKYWQNLFYMIFFLLYLHVIAPYPLYDISLLKTIKKSWKILGLIFPRAYMEYKICCLVSVIEIHSIQDQCTVSRIFCIFLLHYCIIMWISLSWWMLVNVDQQDILNQTAIPFFEPAHNFSRALLEINWIYIKSRDKV